MYWTMRSTTRGLTPLALASAFAACSGDKPTEPAPPPPPSIRIALESVTVGSGLMTAASGSLSGPAPGGTSVRIQSADPGKLLVAKDAQSAGAAAVEIAVPAGSTVIGYYVQAVEGQTGTVTLTGSAAGMTSGTASATLAPTRLTLELLPAELRSDAADQVFRVRVALPGVAPEQVVRTGGGGLPVTLSSQAPTVARLVGGAGGGPLVVRIPEGAVQSAATLAAGGVAVDPQAPGTTTIQAAAPGAEAPATQALKITATPGIEAAGDVTVGAGLESGQQTGWLPNAQPGGITVRLQSSNPALVLLRAENGSAGAGAIDVVVPETSTRIHYYVQALEGASGTATVTLSAPGLAPATFTATVVRPALEIVNLGDGALTAPEQSFAVRVGVAADDSSGLRLPQRVRVGGAALALSLTSSNPSVGRLVSSAGSGATATARVQPGSSESPGTPAAGGVVFRAEAMGTTLVAASGPGYLATARARKQVAVGGARWTDGAGRYRGRNGERFTYLCPPNGAEYRAWGTDVYTDDSSVCTAAVHAGKITLKDGGAVTFEIRPGQNAYIGSTRNGITSSNYGPWGGSFAFP